jgi:ankyrin repeat protein
MSVPGLNPFVPPAPAPAPVPPQIQPPRPGSPTLRNRPAQHDRQAEEDTASGSGLKRGRPSEAEEEGMDIESSSEPQLKRRRGEGEVVTPERLQAPVGNIDPRDGRIRAIQEVIDVISATSSGPRMNPLCYAASRGFELVVRYLVDYASYQDVNIALVHAVKSGHLNIVELLHARGANLAIKDPSGKGCLHYAVESRNIAVLEWLLKKSAHVDEPTQGGMTPLMYACRKGNIEAARMLHAHHANLAARDASGRSCVHYAVASGDVSVMKWLLEQGAEVNVPDSTGLMPLMHACGKGNIEAARLLQAHHANLAAKDDHGRNCMYYAAAHGQQAVVDWLLEQGAPADEPDSQGDTPIYRAFSKRHWPVVNSLLAADVKPDRLEKQTSFFGQVSLYRSGFGPDCFQEAMKDGQYQVLLSLFEKEPESLDLFARTLDPFIEEGKDIDFSDGPPDLYPEIRDLIRIFKSVKKSDTATVSQWLSQSSKSKRKNFIYEYIDTLNQDQFIKSDDENYHRIPILDEYFIKHPLFSYVLHHCLVPNHSKWIQLAEALAGGESRVFDAQKQSILLQKMQTLKASSALAHAFSGKNLSPALEEELTDELLQKLDVMILVFKESLCIEPADFNIRFTELCEKYITIRGVFRIQRFSKSLSRHLGIYVVNADRLAKLVSQAIEKVRPQPIDLPPMASVDRALSMSGQQIIERVLDNFKKSLIQLAKAHELSDEARDLEVVDPVDEDSYPNLSAQLKNKPLNQPYDFSRLPGFTDGLMKLQQEEQDLYADLIFGQWRQISAALGAVLPEPFAAQQ